GAMAVVHYTVLDAGDKPRTAEIREHVSVLEQSASLAPREPYTATAKVINGSASDVQLFGYDETPFAVPDRQTERSIWKSLWRIYRQALYLDRQPLPFAILDWRHTISEIQLLSAQPASGPINPIKKGKP